jgi:hypothetical protein
VDAYVVCGVPAGQRPCPGGSWSCRASTGAESKGGGDAMTPGTVVLWASSVCAMRALARHGHAWARLGACVLTSLVPVFVGAVAGCVQESEERLVDTVVQAGGGQVKRWHGMAMPCHGMVMPLSLWASGGDGKW